jgi:hypothetical protein
VAADYLAALHRQLPAHLSSSTAILHDALARPDDEVASRLFHPLALNHYVFNAELAPLHPLNPKNPQHYRALPLMKEMSPEMITASIRNALSPSSSSSSPSSSSTCAPNSGMKTVLTSHKIQFPDLFNMIEIFQSFSCICFQSRAQPMPTGRPHHLHHHH